MSASFTVLTGYSVNLGPAYADTAQRMAEAFIAAANEGREGLTWRS